MAARATYCPIDPTFPADRQEVLVRAAGCGIVLTQGLDAPAMNHVRVLDAMVEHDIDAEELSVPSTLLDPSTPAYCLLTSGSTGEPKAVVVTRSAITAAVRSLRDVLAIDPTDRVLQFAALSWDTCFEEIFPTLTSGATLVIDDGAHVGSFPRMLRTIAERGVTVLNLPTAYWHELVHHLTEGRAQLPGCVRLVIIGGEAVRPAQLTAWHSLETGRIRLVNTYGCTETALVTHAVDLHGPCSGGADAAWPDAQVVPIGRPLAHVVEFIDEEGELLVGGASLAFGYRGLPEATAERFVTRDVGHGRQRYFRTGDRVARTRDGNLVHRGRIDGQIKVRGIRVEPAEVEAEIAKHPSVAAVAVTGASIANRMTMVALVVVHSTADGLATSSDITDDLRRRVPSHLVPTHIVTVPNLVYTASGKVDRPRSYQRYAAQLHRKGKSMTSQNVLRIFCSVLETDGLTVETDFFLAGGDSLLATRVLSAIERDCGVELEFADFANARSPEALAERIASLQS